MASQRRLHPRHIAVVVGAPDVDDPVEAALQLVHVVGDVGGEIGGLAVVAHHHAVLLVAVVGGAKPPGTVLLVEVARFAQAVDDLVHRAGLHQGALRVPLLVADAEQLQVVADVVEDDVQAQLEDVAIAVVAEQPLGAVDEGVDVLLLVAAPCRRARRPGCPAKTSSAPKR